MKELKMKDKELNTVSGGYHTTVPFKADILGKLNDKTENSKPIRSIFCLGAHAGPVFPLPKKKN